MGYAPLDRRPVNGGGSYPIRRIVIKWQYRDSESAPGAPDSISACVSTTFNVVHHSFSPGSSIQNPSHSEAPTSRLKLAKPCNCHMKARLFSLFLFDARHFSQRTSVSGVTSGPCHAQRPARDQDENALSCSRCHSSCSLT